MRIYAFIGNAVILAAMLSAGASVFWMVQGDMFLVLSGMVATIALLFAYVVITGFRQRWIRNQLSVMHTGASGSVGKQLAYIKQREMEVITFVNEMVVSQSATGWKVLSETDILGKGLLALQSKMKDLQNGSSRQSSMEGGIAKLIDILKKGRTLEELSTLVLSQIVRDAGAIQGGMFVTDTNGDGEEVLKMTASFAYGQEKLSTRLIERGQGLIGQCMESRLVIVVDDVPPSYTKITSSLGEASPRQVVIVPLLFNGVLYGAIELALFQAIEEERLNFVKAVSVNIAAEVASRAAVIKVENLLEKSNQLASELKSKEEQMRLHVEELRSTQEQMERKQAVLTSVFSAINNTVASIEFDMEGRILQANSIFTSVSTYDELDVIRLTYNDLLPATERNKPQHAMMWTNLRDGKFFEGEFCLMSRAGEDMWLSGTFNPMFDENGKPFKVIMIAHFTTQEKMKQTELTGVISAVKNAVAYAELDESFSCRTANERFMKLFGLKRIDVKGKRFVSLLTNGMNENFTQNEIFALEPQGYEGQLWYDVNGEMISMRTAMTPLFDHQNHLLKIVVVITSERVVSKIPAVAVA